MRVQQKRWLMVVALAVPLVACTRVEPLASPPFAAKKDELPCNTNGNCAMTVPVRVASDDTCEVSTEYKSARVSANKTPDMKWSIDDSLDTSNKYDYEFINLPTASPPVHGIEILNPSGVFTDPDYDGGRKKYKWKNNHSNPAPTTYNYEVNVARAPKGTTNWTPCKRIDPRIIND